MTTKRLFSQRPANAAATTTKAPKGRTDLKHGCNPCAVTPPVQHGCNPRAVTHRAKTLLFLLLLALLSAATARGQNHITVTIGDGSDVQRTPNGYPRQTTEVSLPYDYGFEDGLGDWTLYNCHSSTGVFDSSTGVFDGTAAHSGSYAFRFRWSTTPPQYLISPELEANNGVAVEFYYKAGKSSWPESFKVGYSTTTNDVDAFTWGEEVTGITSTQWQLFSDGTLCPAGTKYIAIACTSNDKQYFFVDDITFEEPGGCEKPYDLAVSDITDISAAFTWNGGNEGFNVDYKKVSESEWTRYATNCGRGVVFDDLEPYTNYQARVEAICYDGASTSGFKSISFTTDMGLPYTCGFENGMDGWGLVDVNLGQTEIKPTVPHNGQYSFSFSSFYSGEHGPQYLISPRFAGTEALTVSFFYCKNYNSNTTFSIGYSTTTGNPDAFTWTDVISATTEWSLCEKTFPVGTRYVAISHDYVDPYVAYILYLDDFLFEAYTPYPKPSSLAVNEPTDVSATLSWTPPQTTFTLTGYAYQYKTLSETAWSAEATVNATSVTLNGLSSNTTYDFRVKALYAGNNASNYISSRFLTEGGMESLPHFQGFENGMGGWRVVDGEPKTGIYSDNPDFIYDGASSFQFDFALSSSPPQYLISPRFDGSSAMTVSFYYHTHIESGFPIYMSYFQVGYSTTTKDLDAFTWGDEIGAWPVWLQYEQDFPLGTKYVAIKGTRVYGMYIDDFCCFSDAHPRPANLAVGDITNESATFHWDEPETSYTILGYVYQYKKTSDANWSAEAITTDTTLTLCGLEGGTKYRFRAKVRFSYHEGVWSTIGFTTEAIGLPNLAASNVTETSATITWEEPQTPYTLTGYVYQYKKVGEANWSAEAPTTSTSVTLNELDVSTEYQFRAKALFSDHEDTYSYLSFTTAMPLPYECGFENGMVGWNMLDVYWGQTEVRPQFPHNGQYSFRFLGWGVSSGERGPQYLISPRFVGTEALTVTFFYSGFNNDTKFSIGYSTTTGNPGAFTWTDVIYASTEYSLCEKTFPVGTQYVAISFDHAYDDGINYGLFLDDFLFEVYSPYLRPTGLTVNELNDVSATLSWTAPPQTTNTLTGYAYQYKKTADADWSDETTTTATTVTLTGLSENYTYDFRLKALYDDGQSSYYVSIGFFTEGVTVSLPFYEEFENGMGGWRIVDGVPGTGIYSDNPEYIRNGAYSFRFDYELPNTDPDPQYLISPRLDGNSSVIAAFYYKCGYELNDTYKSTFQLGYSTTTNDIDAFTWGYERQSWRTWQKTSQTCPKGTKYVAVKWTGGYNLYLDDASFTFPNYDIDENELIIYTPAGWDYFCDRCNYWSSVKLGADISVSRAVGDTESEFRGTFDGQGHTLDVNIVESETWAAPFKEIMGATIRNLKVTGSVAGKRHSAGLVAVARKYDDNTVNTIENCRVSTAVSINNDNAGYMGGIVGHGTNTNLVIRGCVFDGSLTSTANSVGGLQGWSDGNTLTLEDNLFAGTVSAVAFHPVALHNSGKTTNATVSNVYYTVEPSETNPAYIAATGCLAFNDPTVSPIGDATATYDVSSLAVYDNGIQYGNTFYSYVEPMLRHITGYGDDITTAGGWYLIASPLAEPMTPTADNGFLTAEFDLYRFDQSEELEWRNYKANAFVLENSRGYLYASQTNTTLVFDGMPYSGSGEVALVKAGGGPLEGWNLIGNPFGTAKSLGDKPFYRMNDLGTEIIAAETSTVEAAEGVFVVANTDGETVTFATPTRGSSGEERIVINLCSNGTVIDRAIVRFGEGEPLPKLQIRGNAPKVYIPQGGEDYAVVAAQPTGELPLNFKATRNGEYMLTFHVENAEMDYLHFIDNMTGADIDLLATLHPETLIAGEDPQSLVPQYTFTAKTTDYASRFKLVFSAASTGSAADAPFAYVDAGGNIVIMGDAGTASLQVVDMMGRVVVCRDALNASAISTTGIPAGVYVLRLIDGENVKTQKIVVE